MLPHTLLALPDWWNKLLRHAEYIGVIGAIADVGEWNDVPRRTTTMPLYNNILAESAQVIILS